MKLETMQQALISIQCKGIDIFGQITTNPKLLENLGAEDLEEYIRICNAMLSGTAEVNLINLADNSKKKAVKNIILSTQRKAYRQLEKLKAAKGTANIPNELFSADQLAPLLKKSRLHQEKALDLGADSFTPETIHAFNLPEAKRLREAIYSLMDDYRKGNTQYVNKDGGRYIISLTIKELLARAHAEGETRKNIKALIINAITGKGQPMQYIATKKGNTLSFISFLTIRKGELEIIDTRNIKTPQGTIIKDGRIELTIEAEAYSYLEPFMLAEEQDRQLFKNTLKKLDSWGYTQSPKDLSNKIKQAAARIEQNHSLFKKAMPTELTSLIQHKNKPEYWREAIMAIEHKWQTGKQNRKQPMIVTWKELKAQGYLNSHKNNQHKRYWDLYGLGNLCLEMAKEGEILDGCDYYCIKDEQTRLIFPMKDETKQGQQS
jgi:hypothetical protein